MKTINIKRFGYLKYLFFVLPGFTIWLVFSLIPNLQIFQLSLYKWNGISPERKFVGLDNFKNMTLDPLFSPAVWNTVIYILVLCIVQNVIALVLALLLSKNTVSNKFFRTLFFSPLVLGTVMVAMIWGYIYDSHIGALNYFLSWVGLEALTLNWLGIPVLAISCVAFVHLWHNIGYPITLILAGLQTIPGTLYEAAEVEGARKAQIFRKITLPLLMPTLLRVVLLTIIGGAIAFDYVYALGGSLMASKFDTLAVYMFRAVNGVNVGRPSAVGVILVLVIFSTFLVQLALTKRAEKAFM